MNETDQPKINIEDTKEVRCKCDNLYFTPVLKFRSLSVLLAPDGKEHLIPIETLVCDECGEEFKGND